jgi:hypothetical protein
VIGGRDVIIVSVGQHPEHIPANCKRRIGGSRPESGRQPPDEDYLSRRQDSSSRSSSGPLPAQALLALQRAVGNMAVTSLITQPPSERAVLHIAQRSICQPALLQRLASSEGIDGDAANADSVVPDNDNVSIAPPPDLTLDLPGTPTDQYALADLRAMDPTFMPGTPEEPGPRQTSEPDTLMAMRLINAVQRQPAPTGLPDKPAGTGDAGAGDSSDGPHLSTDLGAGGAGGATFPWTLTTTVVYRNLNYRTFPSVLRGLDILHEPQASFLFSIEPSALLSAQLGVGLVNLHLPSLFGTELETQLLTQVQYDATQGTSVGGSVQLEQHIWKGISATFNLSGMWTVPTPGTPASFQIAPGGGITVHTDAF